MAKVYFKQYLEKIEKEWNSGNDESGILAILEDIYEDGYNEGFVDGGEEEKGEWENGNGGKKYESDDGVYKKMNFLIED